MGSPIIPAKGSWVGDGQIMNLDGARNAKAEAFIKATNNNDAVALLFAGSERGSRDGRGITFANPIGTLLDALEVDIYIGA